MTDNEFDVRRKELFKKIIDNVDKYGHSVMGVGSGENTPCFNYSIGASKNGFELIVKGVDLTLGNALINNVLEINDYKLVLGELTLSGDGKTPSKYTIGGEPMRLKLVEVEHSEDTPVGIAHLYAQNKPFKLIEIQFADKNNKLEGEEGYDMSNSKYFSKPVA